MKKLFLVLLSLCLILTICACGKEEPKPTAEKPIEKEVVIPENINVLTGQDNLSEVAIGKRPVAVMINNIKGALPQYGIADADLIFEIPVEGDCTRLMALYGDYTKMPKICSIRSCRYYFPILAVGFDAIYVHWGQDKTIATQVLNSLDIDRLDGITNTYGLYSRDSARRSSGYALEHTGVFDGTGLPDALEKNNVRTDLKEDKTETAFNFAEWDTTVTPKGENADTVNIPFSKAYYSTFTYNSEDKLYYKEHNGSPHIDGKTNEQLAFTNLLILETSISVRDNKGRKNVDWQGGSDARGYYVSNGKIQGITWSKSDEYDYIKIFDEEGKEITMNRGKIYIAYTYPDSMSYTSAESETGAESEN